MVFSIVLFDLLFKVKTISALSKVEQSQLFQFGNSFVKVPGRLLPGEAEDSVFKWTSQ